MGHSEYDPIAKEQRPWNVGRKLGAKRALKAQQVWAIRFWLDRERRLRDRAMFDLAIDSKLRGCDIVKIKIGDLVNDRQVRSRAIVVQQKGHGWLRQPIDGSGLDGPGPTRKAVRSVGGRPQSHLRLALGGLDEKLFETKRAIMRASIGRLRSAPASSREIAIGSRAGIRLALALQGGWMNVGTGSDSSTETL
jgi:hypothetical protein